MTIGLLKGSWSWGHKGWLRVYCRVCGAALDLSGQKPRTRKTEVVYACPKCAAKYEAYFCAADARALKYTCPFCGSKLEIVSPQPVVGR
ncbi:hypothetical protein JCM10135_08040 [Stetteria hydrogenophila]